MLPFAIHPCTRQHAADCCGDNRQLVRQARAGYGQATGCHHGKPGGAVCEQRHYDGDEGQGAGSGSADAAGSSVPAVTGYS